MTIHRLLPSCCRGAALCLLLVAGLAPAAAQELVYIKQDTREATRAASLAASGLANWPSTWHLIGPWDNANHEGLGRVYPPEEGVDLSAEYDGLGGEKALWREFEFPDGQVHSVARFEHNDNATCYLYKRIESPTDQQVRIALGSDDGIAVFLNGERIFENNAVRSAGPDQDFTVLPLKAGANDLLLKITNLGGGWDFYFSPTLSSRLQVKLERLLDRDFPPGGEAAHYRIETLPMPDEEAIEVGGLAFRPDGKLLVGTRRGDIFLVSNPLAEDPDEITWEPYVRGLHEILGLTLVDGRDLYVGQRPEITLIRDTDGDDVPDDFTTICDDFGISGDYHEYLFGPARNAAGDLFVTLNVGFGGGHQAKVPYRGFCLRVTPDGEMHPYAYGLRSPNGVTVAPDGRVYYADNQGEWVATCKLHELQQDDFCGHMASVRWWPGHKDGDQPPMNPPAIWFPYHMSRSASEPLWDTTEGGFGPFAGQCFVGEQGNSLISRVYLEEVGGRMQGACFFFRQGFQCGVNRLCFAPDGTLFVGETNRGWGSTGGRPYGVQRVVYTGVIPAEIHSMAVTPTGWELRFTQPVDPVLAVNPESYFLESYTYNHWATYGSPEIERQQHPLTAVRVSEDGLRIQLEVGPRATGRVYHLELRNFRTVTGQELLHRDAWYTLNRLPE